MSYTPPQWPLKEDSYKYSIAIYVFMAVLLFALYAAWINTESAKNETVTTLILVLATIVFSFSMYLVFNREYGYSFAMYGILFGLLVVNQINTANFQLADGKRSNLSNSVLAFTAITLFTGFVVNIYILFTKQDVVKTHFKQSQIYPYFNTG